MGVGSLIPLVVVIAILVVVVAVLLSKGAKGTKNQPTNTYVSPQQEPKATAGKFCTNCGTKLEAGSAFCTNCGAKQ